MTTIQELTTTQGMTDIQEFVDKIEIQSFTFLTFHVVSSVYQPS